MSSGARPNPFAQGRWTLGERHRYGIEHVGTILRVLQKHYPSGAVFEINTPLLSSLRSLLRKSAKRKSFLNRNSFRFYNDPPLVEQIAEVLGDAEDESAFQDLNVFIGKDLALEMSPQENPGEILFTDSTPPDIREKIVRELRAIPL